MLESLPPRRIPRPPIEAFACPGVVGTTQPGQKCQSPFANGESNDCLWQASRLGCADQRRENWQPITDRRRGIIDD